MKGIICMWHGKIVDIPNGWALCDGDNGTPDLRSRFVAGCPDGIDPGGIAGSTTHNHWVSAYTTSRDIAHTHQVTGNTNFVPSGDFDHAPRAGLLAAYPIHNHPIDFTSQIGSSNHNHRVQVWSADADTVPPFYAILFIMKL